LNPESYISIFDLAFLAVSACVLAVTIVVHRDNVFSVARYRITCYYAVSSISSISEHPVQLQSFEQSDLNQD
jgi:hypothetical protein